MTTLSSSVAAVPTGSSSVVSNPTPAPQPGPPKETPQQCYSRCFAQQCANSPSGALAWQVFPPSLGPLGMLRGVLARCASADNGDETTVLVVSSADCPRRMRRHSSAKGQRGWRKPRVQVILDKVYLGCREAPAPGAFGNSPTPGEDALARHDDFTVAGSCSATVWRGNVLLRHPLAQRALAENHRRPSPLEKLQGWTADRDCVSVGTVSWFRCVSSLILVSAKGTKLNAVSFQPYRTKLIRRTSGYPTQSTAAWHSARS